MKFIPEHFAIDSMLSQMDDDEKKQYLKVLWGSDYKEINKIHSNYGFELPVPMQCWMSEDDAKVTAERIIESGKTDGEVFSEFMKKYSCNMDRSSDISLDEPTKIINALHSVDGKCDNSNPATQFFSESIGWDALTIFQAYVCADISGCINLKNRLFRLYIKEVVDLYGEKAISIANRNSIISEDRSKAKKGKTNKHHGEAIEIAQNTWGDYPNASLAGLSEEIYSHLRNKYNGVPSSDTVKKWLKDSELNPNVKPKNRNFKLVLTKGE